MLGNENIGRKALNLESFQGLTTFYLVLEISHYEHWTENGFLIESTKDEIEKICEEFKSQRIDKIILRSSAKIENIKNRGRYKSISCDIDPVQIEKKILDIYKHCQQSAPLGSNQGMAILIQEYIDSKVIGHASNERRVSEEKENWYVEMEVVESNEIRNWNLTVEPSQNFDHSIVSARNLTTVRKSLESFCSLVTNDSYRTHIEWIWDGTNFWIVQVDYEYSLDPGFPPASNFRFRDKPEIVDVKSLEILESVDNLERDWHKVYCLKTFKRIGIPNWDIYTLENDRCKKNLQNGLVDIELKSDLNKLLTRPIVIRSDIISSDKKEKVMLPRTETIHEKEAAIDFLINTSKHFESKGIQPNDYCFLFHQFILSTSCAYASARPDFPNVRVDSNWGIVEGLYYLPCDSFECNHKTAEITEKIRCKTKYIDVESDGSWITKESGYKYDWKRSLTKSQILKISEYTAKICKELDRPVTVMYFIYNRSDGFYPEILPWYFGEEEPPEQTNQIDEIFISNFFEINNKEDLENLKGEIQKGESFKIQLKIGLEAIRDNSFIKEIADYLNDKDCVVFLDGSVLSHPYYILESSGIQVRCYDPLEASFKPKEYYKLVRDGIPVFIKSRNEQVNSEKLPPQTLLQFLKIKIVEEALELYWEDSSDKLVEEMADIYEVLLGLCKVHGIGMDVVQSTAKAKKDERGGFEEGVFLIATKEKSLIKLNQDEELFVDTKIDNSLRKRSINKPFKKGTIDMLKTLNEVDSVKIPYLHPRKMKSDPVRFLLKDDIGKLMTVTYHEDEIKINFSDLDLDDPDQNDLLME